MAAYTNAPIQCITAQIQCSFALRSLRADRKSALLHQFVRWFRHWARRYTAPPAHMRR